MVNNFTSILCDITQIHPLDKLAAELTLLQQQQIIAPVTEPTDWCAPIVVTPKKNSDSIRMCVDLSHLNHFVKRERYQLSSPAEAVADMTASRRCRHI